MSSSAGPSRVSRPRKSSAATSNGSTASSTGTAEGARTGGSEMRGLEDGEVMAGMWGLRDEIERPRFPDALQRSSRCCAEPGSSRTLKLCTAPALQRTAAQELRAALRPGQESSRLVEAPGQNALLRVQAVFGFV